MKRKGFTRLLSCALLLSVLLGALVFPASAATQFVDVYPGMLSREYFDAINYIVDNGIMNGTDSTHFSPYQNITRGMFVTILYRYSESEDRIPSSFSDVPSSTYYYYPIGWATSKGIVNGVTSTTFNPEGVITKEQMAVMLYRYAMRIESKSYNVNSFVDITGHPDYSGVSPYAREAVKWAKTYNVFPLTDNSQYISATANMNRAYAALYVANYSKNVTGFPQKDRFSFINGDGDFHSKYVMLESIASRMDYLITQYYSNSPSVAAQNKTAVRSRIGTNWTGSCFGYTFSLYLDKLGKIDFNKNFYDTSSTMNEVAKPVENTFVESIINFYQFSQYITAFKNAYYYYDTPSKIASGVDLLYSQVRNHGCIPIGYIFSESRTQYGHSILITSISKNSSNVGSDYTISLIDPNNINGYQPEYASLRIESGRTYIKRNGEEITLSGLILYSYTSMNFFNSFDLDGDYNSGLISIPSNTTSNIATTVDGFSMSDEVDTFCSEGTTTIYVPASSFQISNAEGDTLTFDGESFSGTMELIDQRVLLNGSDSPCTLMLCVKDSDSFSYNNLGNVNSTFTVISSHSFGSISGNGIQNVFYDAKNRALIVDGDDVSYSAWLDIGIPDYEHFYLSGNGANQFSIYATDVGVATEGIYGENECSFASADTISYSTINVMLENNYAFDFSAVATTGNIRVAPSDGSQNGTLIPIDSLVEVSHYEP